ncbi:MAG: hypothetical protein ACJ741_18655 [Pyrinomonadaceae bacterium]
MRQRAIFNGRVLALVLCAAAAGAADARRIPAPSAQEQKQGEQKQKGGASDAESKAAQAVQSAADPNAVAVAASEFVKKYPKSSLRPQVARAVLSKIAAVQDPAQRATFAEGFSKIFDSPDEAMLAAPVIIDAYVDAKRYDDAYRLATPDAVAKFEDPLGVMISLAITGADQVRQQNPKYVPASQQLGLKAVELIEGDKKPARVDDARWGEYKTKWLPQLYQSLGLLSLASGDKADAKAKLAKALALNPTDANTYILLGAIANDEYQQTAQQHKAASGAAKDELLKQAQAQLDVVIDAWAHAVALTEGDARADQMRAQLMQDLESYYKYRHGSADGLQQLIAKYKKPAGQP